MFIGLDLRVYRYYMNEHSNMFFGGIKKDMGGFYMVIMHKYHGLGNDYLVFDPNENQVKLR